MLTPKQRAAALAEANQAHRAQAGKTLPLLEWAERERRILDRATGKTGEFSLDAYPWLRELYSLDQMAIIRLIVRKGAQLGISEYLVNYALWCIHQHRMTVFYALPPGASVVGDFSHQRISPAITDTAALRGHGLDLDNVGLKRFANGGVIYIRGTNIPGGDPGHAAQLSAVAADIAIIDEIDRVPPAALPLIRARIADSRFPMERNVSTPTVPSFGIDALYQDTDQREPYVECDACSQWRPIVWDMVNENAEMVCRCGNVFDMGERWKTGKVEYRQQNKGSTIPGYWIPALVSPRADLVGMVERAQSTNEEEVQAFWNNDLGLAYEPRGSKLTDDLLEACKRDYEFFGQVPGARAAMGVDVQGADLHVYIKQRVEEGKQRALWIGTVPNFEDLDSLMKRYDVSSCVVDGMPEIRSGVTFAKRFRGRVYLSWFGKIDGNKMATYNEERQLVRVDRDRAIGASHANIEQQIDELPRDYTFIDGFVAQMTTLTRVRTATAQGQVVYKFLKTGRPDHYDLAKAYCEVAMERIVGFGVGAPLKDVPQATARSKWTSGTSGGGRFSRTEGGSRWRR